MSEGYIGLGLRNDGKKIIRPCMPNNRLISDSSISKIKTRPSVGNLFEWKDISNRPIPKSPPKQLREVMVIIESIYGKFDYLRLCTIDVMTSKKDILQTEKICLVVQNRDSKNILSLTDRSLLKPESECFQHPWDGTSVAIKMSVRSDVRPSLMRIFNPHDGLDGHAEKITVYVDRKCICTDIIPVDYGKQISIIQAIEEEKPDYKKFLESFGFRKPIFPVILSYSVEIELLENYSGNNNIFGVNCFEIVTYEGKRVKINQIQSIKIENGNISTIPQELLERKEKHKYVLIQATNANERPKINFTLYNPIRVAFVRIVGYLPLLVKDVAVSKVKITCGKFISKFSKVIFSPVRVNDDTVTTTDVYFADKVGLPWFNEEVRRELSAFGPFL